MKIALDAMGGDFAPAYEVQGAIECLRQSNNRFHVVLVGDQNKIKAELQKIGNTDGLDFYWLYYSLFSKRNG
jgi:glycerol-3-phosphate acyltransferase PlsX